MLCLHVTEGMVQHLKATVQPGSRELKTVSDADTFLDSIENCVFGELYFSLLFARSHYNIYSQTSLPRHRWFNPKYWREARWRGNEN
jgi:hypothetical protein